MNDNVEDIVVMSPKNHYLYLTVLLLSFLSLPTTCSAKSKSGTFSKELLELVKTKNRANSDHGHLKAETEA